MNPIIENMMERRTIRKYTGRPVSDETMQELYKAIEGTQSWANTQCWKIVGKLWQRNYVDGMTESKNRPNPNW